MAMIDYAGGCPLLGTSRGADGDFHIVSEGVEEPEEPICRVDVEHSANEGRDLGLVNPEDCRGPGLSQLPLGEDAFKERDQLETKNTSGSIEGRPIGAYSSVTHSRTNERSSAASDVAS